MEYKDFKYYFSTWKKLNIDFIITAYKNYKIPKKKNVSFNDPFVKQFYKQANPVFVLSTGRCGTEYLTNILKKISQLDVFHSPKPEMLFYTKFAYEFYKTKHIEIIDIVNATRSELILKSFMRKRRFVETNNLITFFSYALAELFPNSKFIHLIRHPGGFVRSGIRRKWYEGKSLHDISRITPLIKDVDFTQWSNIEKVGWLWNETNEFIETFKNNLSDSKRIITIRAEDMFSRIETIKEIFTFLNASMEENFIKKQIKKKPVNEQKLGIFPAFENWSEEEKDLLRKVATMAIKYNYVI